MILGGSMAGLLTARVLSEHFQRVTILEKDKLEERKTPRKGVPQGQQLHIVLAQGLQIMEEYFPGFTAELAAGGAIVSNDLALDLRWFSNGGYRPQAATGLKSVMLTRPFLEETLRRQVTAISNVHIADDMKVTGLCINRDGTRITGVHLVSPTEQELKADLVIDTTGRGSRSPAWLAEVGYTKPEIEEISVKIRYASRLYRRPRQYRTLILTNGQPPHQARVGIVMPIEGERMIVTLHGRGEQNPSSDEMQFMAHIQSLSRPDVAEAIAGLEPLSDVVMFNVPKTRWHHYEKLTHFPAGYLVLGDAVCALNPVYGQGMTSAAMQVVALDRLLQKRPLSDTFWQPYFKQIAKVVSIPWQLTTSEDFLFPQTEGPPPKTPGFMTAYLGKLVQVVNHDAEVFKAFSNVLHLTKPPAILFHPRIVWRVLRTKLQPTIQMETAATSQQPIVETIQ